MNKLSRDKRAQILDMMAEGLSIRSICRLTGTGKNTVARLLVAAGMAFREYQHQALRDLPCKRVQADEIWSFCAMKEKTAKAKGQDRPAGVGEVWTWTAICADTKLCASWHVGTRDAGCAYEFMTDLAGRLRGRVQLTTDGHGAYLVAVPGAFGRAIDYAQLIKIYGVPADAEKRYSPPECLGTKVEEISGNPDPEHISTAYVERRNLSMRMGMRRFTRLTNAFSTKIENHVHAISVYFMHYNFVRIHQTLRCSPAMEAKVTDRLWSLDDLVAVVEEWESKQALKEAG